MGNKIIMDTTTTNNSIYNRTRKRYLEDTGRIHCSWCPYHRRENADFQWEGLGYPNWKLISKNKKQWMKKPKKIIKLKSKYFYNYIEWEF